jgi:hypothetical protein
MFFKSKKKKSEKDLSISPKVQTAEGWKRMMLRKWKEFTKKKS